VLAELKLLSFRARTVHTHDYYSANKHEEYFLKSNYIRDGINSNPNSNTVKKNKKKL